MNEITQIEHDNLADIAWWIRGALDTNGKIPFDDDHFESLKKVIENIKQDLRSK